jgi:hypothetical protein
MTWVAGATAVIGLAASLAGGVHWFESHREHHIQLEAQMAVARSQAKQHEYEASARSYRDIRKENPLYHQAFEEQLNATMLWVENFQILGQDNQQIIDFAAPQLDQIMPVLDAGLAGAKGSRAADVQAHLGWAHWLNSHLAQRENGQAAVQNVRAALQLDPSNVYANAILGNLMLRTGGSSSEAIRHLRTAIETGKARPFVRSMQLTGLMYFPATGTIAELFKAVNDMRKSGEVLDKDQRREALSWCCEPNSAHSNIVESLSAVDADEAWKTYLWLAEIQEGDQADKTQRLHREFVYANLLEISGKRAESLEAYQLLQQESGSERRNEINVFEDSVNEAIRRLSQK